MRTVTVAGLAGHEWDRADSLRRILDLDSVDVVVGNVLSAQALLDASSRQSTGDGPGWVEAFVEQLDGCLDALGPDGPVMVTNAGGLDPRGLARRLRELLARRRPDLTVAVVYAPVEPEAHPALGGFGIARAIARGAHIIVTGPIAVASLTLGAATAALGWSRDAWDQLAGGVVAGLIVAGGTRVTGGDFSGFTELPLDGDLGAPLVTLDESGGCVVTKGPGSGAVTVDTVTGQLLHRFGGDRSQHPDVTAHLETLEVTQEGPDRVAVLGATGRAPLAVSLVNRWAVPEYRNAAGFVLTGLDVEAKLSLVRSQVERAMGPAGPHSVEWQHRVSARDDPSSPQEASSLLTCHVSSPDRARVGEVFARAVRSLGSSSYPGFHLAEPLGPPEPVVRRRSRFVPQVEIAHRVSIGPEGQPESVPPPWTMRRDEPGEVRWWAPPPEEPDDDTVELPLGRVAYAASAEFNLGDRVVVAAWVPAARPRRLTAFGWLTGLFDSSTLPTLLPGLSDVGVTVTPMPNLAAVIASFERPTTGPMSGIFGIDPHATAIGEWLRARVVPVPRSLLEG